MALDGDAWPKYASPKRLPQRALAAFPPFSSLKPPADDLRWLMHGFALRLAVAFTIAHIPEAVLERRLRAHWFSMTVALIMVPSPGGTFRNVAHRVSGTLLGIGLGSALAPLFRYDAALIVLLGLVTYAAVVFLPANYAVFTFFITGWVFVTMIGTGAPQGITTLYRCLWTLAAGALVLIVMYAYPSELPLSDVDEKLAAFARAVGSFTEEVQKESAARVPRRGRNDGDDVDGVECEEGASASPTAAPDARDEQRGKVEESRALAIKARIAALQSIDEATWASSTGYRIDPHSLALSLASDLISALVVPQVVSLVTDGGADDLLSDVDGTTYANIERLAKRLEGGMYSTAVKRDADDDSDGRSCPFSRAIARAHRRLDDAHILTRSTIA